MFDIFVESFGDLKFGLFADVLNFLYVLAPLWIPLLLFFIFFEMWLHTIRMEFILKQGFTLLEIKLSKEMSKSPAAMELVYIALYQTGSATEIDTYFLGKIRPWFSLELVSTEGQVHFYIWSHRKWKNVIEAQIYGQYPTVEIHEAPDYSTAITHDLNKWFMWMTYFQLEKPDAYPIKTYVDYGLDKDPKEEFKIEPMLSVLEFLGSLGKGEHCWIQILIQAHKKEKFKDGRLFTKDDWKVHAMHEIEKIREEATIMQEGVENPYPVVMLSKDQQETISAIERSLAKFPFEVGIRAGYFAKNENANMIQINGLIGSFRQYGSPTRNGFKLGAFTDFDYPWEDFKRMRRTAREKAYLEAYQMRSFFQPPWEHHLQSPFILTTEELATIYHFPGDVVQTPSLARIPSKKVEPPSNLPI